MKSSTVKNPAMLSLLMIGILVVFFQETFAAKIRFSNEPNSLSEVTMSATTSEAHGLRVIPDNVLGVSMGANPEQTYYILTNQGYSAKVELVDTQHFTVTIHGLNYQGIRWEWCFFIYNSSFRLCRVVFSKSDDMETIDRKFDDLRNWITRSYASATTFTSDMNSIREYGIEDSKMELLLSEDYESSTGNYCVTLAYTDKKKFK